MDLSSIVWSDERMSFYVKETETHTIEIFPMLYNDRIVMCPKDRPLEVDYGWCDDKVGMVAFLAALAWDPDTEIEPVGYKKQIGLRPGATRFVPEWERR